MSNNRLKLISEFIVSFAICHKNNRDNGDMLFESLHAVTHSFLTEVKNEQGGDLDCADFFWLGVKHLKDSLSLSMHRDGIFNKGLSLLRIRTLYSEFSYFIETYMEENKIEKIKGLTKGEIKILIDELAT